MSIFAAHFLTLPDNVLPTDEQPEAESAIDNDVPEIQIQHPRSPSSHSKASSDAAFHTHRVAFDMSEPDDDLDASERYLSPPGQGTSIAHPMRIGR